MFEDALIESQRPKKPSRRKLMTMPIALLIHGLIVVVVLFVNFWMVDKLPEPSIQVTFYSAPPPPPPPAAQRERRV